MICDNITVGSNGHLYFAGQDTVALAKQYGTPLYLMDEDYNRLPRPATVMLRGGESYVAIRRETLADLCACDL